MKYKFWQSKRFWFWFRIISLAVVLIVASFAGYLYFKFDNMIGNFGTDVDVPKEESANVKPKTILFLGSDYRAAHRSFNTDVIIVATINPEQNKAAVVSIPRDTYMNPEGFSGGKANSYYARIISDNKDDYETDLKKVYSDYLGVKIDYALVFNFDAFAKAIDELGGVDVNVDMDMRYVDNADGTNIDLKAGQQTLDGKQALDYVRYRQSNRGTGASNDFERNVRQEQVIASTLDRIKSFGGVLSLGGVFDALGDNIKSDIPSSEIKVMLRTYAGLNRSNIQFFHLEGNWQSPYVYVKDEDVQKAASQLNSLLQPAPTTQNATGTLFSAQ
jgi:LCP family protein required for cell wall assembly